VPVSAPWGAAGEFAASRHGVLHRRQAASLGLSATVIARLKRDGLLHEPLPGILVVAGSPDTWHQRLSIATAVGNQTVVAGYRAGAALHRFDGHPPGVLEVVSHVRRSIDLPGLVVHVSELFDDVVEIDGIRCTSIARTLADLGSVEPFERVELAFNHAWRTGVSLAWLRSEAERLHRPGQRGTGVLLRLLDAVPERARPLESPLEARVEQLLMRAGVVGLERQFEVRDPAGRFVARVDFAVPSLRIAFEAHSLQHHVGVSAARRDAARDTALRKVEWIAEYITAADVRDAPATQRRIQQLVRARTAEIAAKCRATS